MNKSADTALNTVSPQRTSKWPNSKPHWGTRQQAIAKTPAKWSAYHIPSVNVVFVILVFKVCLVKFYSQKPQEALNLLVTEECYWVLFHMPLYTSFTQFAECTSTDCKWNGITKECWQFEIPDESLDLQEVLEASGGGFPSFTACN
jgi:hypothetical protein